MSPIDAPYRTEAANEVAYGPFEMPRFIVTERLVLAPLETSHHDAIAQFFGDENASRFVGGVSNKAEAFAGLCAFAGQWALFGFGHYAILDQDGGFLGFAGLWMPLDWPELEVGYCLMPFAEGRGYATEAVRAILDEASHRGAKTVVSYIHPDNARSLALAERLGATREPAIVLRGSPAVVMRHDLSSPVRPLADDLPYLEPSAMPSSIATGRLVLERWKVTHFEPFAAMMADEETTRFTTGVIDRPRSWRTLCVGAGSWQLRGYGTYAIMMDGAFAGFCGLYHPHGWPDVELAYTLAPGFRGKGIAREAAEAVRSVAAEQGLSRLTSYIHLQNAASIRVAEALDARREGTIMLDGEDVVLFAHRLAPEIAAVPA